MDLVSMYETCSLSEIERTTGVSRQTAKNRLVAAGIEIRPNGNGCIPWADMAHSLGYASRDSMLLDMYGRLDMSTNKIAERLGVYVNSVRDRLRRLGVAIQRPGGPNNVRTKISVQPCAEFPIGATLSLTASQVQKYGLASSITYSEIPWQYDGCTKHLKSRRRA